jgi:hypothetical protein
MLAAVSFAVGITAVTKKYLTTFLTELRLLTVCHKFSYAQGTNVAQYLTLFVYARYSVIQSLHKVCTLSTTSLNPYTRFVR